MAALLVAMTAGSADALTPEAWAVVGAADDAAWSTIGVANDTAWWALGLPGTAWDLLT